jgi:hypothetical protein
MVDPLAEFIVRDYTAVDAQVAQIAERERILTKKLRIANYRQTILIAGAALLGIGLFLILAAIAYRIAFPLKPKIIETTKIIEKTVTPKIIIETSSGLGSVTRSNGEVVSVIGATANNTIQDTKQRLSSVGISNTGNTLVASLTWDNLNDLDLMIEEPNGKKISYKNKVSRSQGSLDIDANAGTSNRSPVENISWPKNSIMLIGRYKLFVTFFRRKGPIEGSTKYNVVLRNGESTEVFSGQFANRSISKTKKLITEFEVSSSKNIKQNSE